MTTILFSDLTNSVHSLTINFPLDTSYHLDVYTVYKSIDSPLSFSPIPSVHSQGRG